MQENYTQYPCNSPCSTPVDKIQTIPPFTKSVPSNMGKAGTPPFQVMPKFKLFYVCAP